MTVRRRVGVLIAACMAVIVLMIGVLAGALWAADHSARRLDGIDGRLDALSRLIGTSGRYAEKVAEVMLLGRNKTDELDGTRIDMERQLARLTQTTRDEIGTLFGMDEIQEQLPEIEASRRIVEVYHAIDASVNRTLAMQRAGNAAAALEMYRVEVAFRLGNELDPLLTTAADNERKEVRAELSWLGTVEAWLIAAGATVALGALVVLTLLGLALVRAVTGPLASLAERARLVAGGSPDPGMAEAAGEFVPLSNSLRSLGSTLEQQRRQLTETGERLREVDGKRGQFLADVSHELRTPLTILRGEADVALRGKDESGRQRQALERIQGQAAELAQLLEDMLEFARQEAEDQPIVRADLKLDEVVAAAAQEAEVLGEPREIVLTLTLEDGGCHVDGDFRRLKQALIIGLDNAIKHSPPGGHIEIAATRDGDSAAIRILDEGAGVDDADLPRVFERFFRGRSGGEILSGGVGIGLAIAKDIVERHGGRISLANRQQGGAVLTILLPLEPVMMAPQ